MNHTFLRGANLFQTNFNKVKSVWLIIIGVVFLIVKAMRESRVFVGAHVKQTKRC